VGGIGVKLGGENHSLKTQTYEAGLVKAATRPNLLPIVSHPSSYVLQQISIHFDSVEFPPHTESMKRLATRCLPPAVTK
jgi:hypothetical protein